MKRHTQKKTVSLSTHHPAGNIRTCCAGVPWQDVWCRWKRRPGRWVSLSPCIVSRSDVARQVRDLQSELDSDLMWVFNEKGPFNRLSLTFREGEDVQVSIDPMMIQVPMTKERRLELKNKLWRLDLLCERIDRFGFWSEGTGDAPSIYTKSTFVDRREAESALAWYLFVEYDIGITRFQWSKNK